ncbi:MAG: hypothetical protein ACI89L_002880, partial [Phycisphaerales bacterium]
WCLHLSAGVDVSGLAYSGTFNAGTRTQTPHSIHKTDRKI